MTLDKGCVHAVAPCQDCCACPPHPWQAEKDKKPESEYCCSICRRAHELAREKGTSWSAMTQEQHRAVREAIEAEREACAVIAERDFEAVEFPQDELAAKIRERGDQK